MEGVNRDGGGRQSHPRGLTKRRHRVDHDDPKAEAPLERTFEELLADSLVVAAVDDFENLPGVPTKMAFRGLWGMIPCRSQRIGSVAPLK